MIVPNPRRLRCALVGLALWAAAVVVLPAPMAARILLLAPLVVLPRLLPLLPDRRWVGRLGGWVALLAAVPLVAAFGLPAGLAAGALALPWLLLACAGAIAGVLHGLTHLPSIVQPRRWADLGIDVALGFWAVGSVFAMLDRLGFDTGFSPAIVLLTATHFHFAGLGLLGVASLLAASRSWLRISVAGLMVGIPLTAVGFVLVSDPINATGALVVGLSGIGVAVALLTSPGADAARWVRRAAGVALLVGMPMGIAWSLSLLAGASFVDLDTMIRTHGVLNATAVVLAVMTYPADGR
jgi:hypothetical protein